MRWGRRVCLKSGWPSQDQLQTQGAPVAGGRSKAAAADLNGIGGMQQGRRERGARGYCSDLTSAAAARCSAASGAFLCWLIRQTSHSLASNA